MEHGILVRYPLRLVALAVLAAFLFLVAGDRQQGGAATGSGEANAGIGAWRIGNPDLGISESTQLLGRYSVVVINAYEWPLVPIIKAESPGTRVLMYTSAIDIQQDCDTPGEELTCATGITMYDVNTNDSSWILRDANGNAILNAKYPYYYVGDIGSSSYRSKWASHVANQARSLGFDGVSIDGVLGAFEGETGGVVPAKYPTDSAWANAMAGFVDAVGPALKAQGLYVGAEVYSSTTGTSNNNGSFDGSWWQRVAPDLSALFCEYFEQNPTDWTQMYSNTHLDWTDNWDGWLNLVDIAQNAGADFFGLDYGTGGSTDSRDMTYGKASFLLKWNGGGGVYFWDYRDGAAHDLWNPNWTMNIGTPNGSMYSVGSGAFRRDYSAGTVIVNPMQTTQTFTLGGTYLTPSGSSVTSVTLAPTSAAILQSTTSSGGSGGSTGSSGGSTGGSTGGATSSPSNSSAPLVSGTAQVGSQLTASAGNWSGTPTSYAIAWLRCDSSGANCTTISGQTNLTYVVASADQGATIRVAVTATNAAGSSTDLSAATAVVTGSGSGGGGGAAPSNTSLPLLSGTAQVGSQLISTGGRWSNSPTSYSIGWLRCDSSGGNCTTISGQTDLRYLLATADQGATIRSAVIAVNAYGSSTAYSSPSPIVQGGGGASPSNTSVPVLSGSAQVGSTLTATGGTWTGSPTSYSIAWLRCNAVGGSCTTISGQSDLTYLLTSADQGTTIRAAVTASNANGSSSADVSAPSAVVQGGGGNSPSLISLPLVSGSAQVGSQLSATGGSWTGSPTSYSITWLRCNSSAANCTTISGQTNLTYVLTSADRGATIRVAVTAANAYGSSSPDLSAPTAVVS